MLIRRPLGAVKQPRDGGEEQVALLAFAGDLPAHLGAERFRHTAQPGAYYRMADLVGWNAPTGAREAAWLEVELARDAPRRTLFNGKYCLATNDPNFGNAAFRASLEQRLRDAVK